MGSYSILEPLRLLNLISDLVECTFLQIYEVLEGFVLLIAILEKAMVFAVAGCFSRSFETYRLSETGRFEMM
jgi:hypothetical protein